jgi:hypothetical protein
MTIRGEKGRVAAVRARLGERDLAVLRTLHRVRLLRGDQVRRLHVAEGSPLTQSRRTRNLLHRLHQLDLVVRSARVVGGVRAGSNGHIYGLSGLGQAVLDAGGTVGRRRRRIWDTKPFFQDHVLAVAELYVGLVEASRTNQCELLDFDSEPACWRRFTGSSSETVTLKPDAYVRLGVGEYERSAFVEVDMASESLATIQRKCRTFIAYWRTGREQQQEGVFPLVLWLVPNQQRRQRITDVIVRLTAETRALFAVALHHDGPALLSAAPDGGAA